MKKSVIICSLIILLLLIMLVISNTSFNIYKSRINETALSLCADEILSENAAEFKVENVKNLLTFTDLPDKHKEILIIAVHNEDVLVSNIAKSMKYFEFNRKNLNLLKAEIEELASVSTVKLINKTTAEELALMMIKDIFKGGANFKTETGNGNNFIKRYYCSNVCIDICGENTVRYISKIKADSSEDLLLNWLMNKENAYVDTVNTVKSIEYRKMIGTSVDASIFVDIETNRVIAAEITLKS